MLFCAELTDFKIVQHVLRSIAIKEHAILHPMAEGLKITLDEMKCIETSAYLPIDMFAVYQLSKDENVKFKVSLKILVEVLNIFGDDSNSHLKITYKQLDAPLCLILKHNEENVAVDCEIKTMNVNDHDISLSDECNLNKLVVKADILSEFLHRLDNNAEEISITMSPYSPYFTLATSGISGDAKIAVSKNSDCLSIYECKETTSAKYCLNNMRHVIKVMNYAHKVAISMGESGLLGMQLVINNSEEKTIYVEFYVMSQFATDDD